MPRTITRRCWRTPSTTRPTFALRRGLREFRLAASVSEVAVVFYAGHGIEVDSRNYLVPVDARLQSDDDVEFETVPLDLLSRTVDGASELGLIILDACRDNPFAVAMHRSGATRSIGRGLARVEPSGATLVAFAEVRVFTAAGSEYQDGMALSAGQYEIAVEAAGHEPFRQTLAVEGPTTYRIALCGLETRKQTICEDKSLARTGDLKKYHDKRIEGRGTHRIVQGDDPWYFSSAGASYRRIEVHKACQVAEENAKRAIHASCRALGGTADRTSFRVVRQECDLEDSRKPTVIDGFHGM